MIESTARPMTRRVLVVDDALAHDSTAGGRSVRALCREMQARDIETASTTCTA